MAAAFDTLTAARRMEDAGMKREQAEAVAAAVRSAAESGREELATKADIAALGTEISALGAELKADIAALRAEFQAELQGEIAALRAELQGEIAALRTEFVDRVQSTERRIYAAVFGAGGLLFAALKLVP